MPKKDFTQIAFAVVQQATGEAPKPPAKTARQINSARGGVKGGASRMGALSQEEKTKLGKQAAEARWKK